ncbi:MAG: acyl-homoserine-lactone synthase [Bdellovibrionales bacterium]
MISILSLKNINTHGGLLPGILSCRYRNFVARQNYMHYPVGTEMEHDEYDTPATVYFAWVNSTGRVCGTARLNPTDRPYMLRDKFPFMVEFEKLPDSKYVLEGSRICIDNDLPISLRTQIKKELVLAYYEYGLSMGAHTIIGLMQTLIMRRVYGSSGCCPVSLGREQDIGDQKCVAAKMSITSPMYERVKMKLSVRQPVVGNLLFTPESLAA